MSKNCKLEIFNFKKKNDCKSFICILYKNRLASLEKKYGYLPDSLELKHFQIINEGKLKLFQIIGVMWLKLFRIINCV